MTFVSLDNYNLSYYPLRMNLGFSWNHEIPWKIMNNDKTFEMAKFIEMSSSPNHWQVNKNSLNVNTELCLDMDISALSKSSKYKRFSFRLYSAFNVSLGI